MKGPHKTEANFL